ncbi:hypothetical protein [Gillisia sp. JM1]|uniref:hypothetical protein n=1 Tax=Gillisia sp. JM1 TaxID=1283286 RepID=UPI000479AD6E|nr:hypothetical protein [Gillisia sp. JM1]
MEKKLLLIAILLFVYITSTQAQDLSGKWRWNSDNGQVVYSLTLNHISKDRVTGVHCIQNFKIKITECSTPEEEYTVILVKITENIFKGSILSGTGKEREMRDIQIQYLPLEDRIIFSLTTVPEEPFLIPVEAILQR